MSNYPERISISPTYRQTREDDFYLVDRDAFPGRGVEYIRKDVSAALVAAAREDALREALDIIGTYDENSTCSECCDVTAINEAVTALITKGKADG